MIRFWMACVCVVGVAASLAACGGGGAAAGGGSAGGGGGDVTVANAPIDGACQNENSLSPVYPDEVGHWTASRLTPPSYPFTVSKVGYSLAGEQTGGACDAELPHKVQVFVGAADGGALPASPSTAGAVQTITVANSSGQADLAKLDGGVRGRIFTHTLSAPITLTTGQALVVSVQMAGRPGNNDAGVTTCLATCKPSTGTAKAKFDYWSNAVNEPYQWADLVGDFGFTQYNTIRAIGK